MLSAEIGFERGGSGGADDGGKAADAAANVAQGQATKATSIGAAVKDFLTTPQVPSLQPKTVLSSDEPMHWSAFAISGHWIHAASCRLVNEHDASCVLIPTDLEAGSQ